MPSVSILGQDSILVDHDIWGAFIVRDLLQHVPSSTYVIITDTNLDPIYVPGFKAAFRDEVQRQNLDARLLSIGLPPGEASKTRETKSWVEDWMLSDALDPPCDTKTVVVALGGGVVGDFSGFVASTFKRGVRVVQVPTSLLAMVDSSIGGKTAINTRAGKNLIGSFWQPSRIYIDLAFLDTLPTRELINGMAEIIKTAAIWDESAFEFLENHASQFMSAFHAPPSPTRLAHLRDTLQYAILSSVRVKADVVSRDEREGGLRNLLNFGHSIGHAIEGILAPEIRHGECVAVGMVLEAVLARYLGVLDGSAVARLTKCLSLYDLPTSLKDIRIRRHTNKRCGIRQLMTIMSVDKKNVGKAKRITLLAGIGRTHEQRATAVADQDIRLILSAGIRVHPCTSPRSHVECTPPGSKSISNRALVLAALGRGTCRIHNLLHSDDTEVMMTALTALKAATFAWEDDGRVLAVTGNGGLLKAAGNPLYLGNAGTASRFLTSVVALADPGSSDFSMLTGNARMQQRPIGPLVNALRENGVRIEYVSENKSLPLKIPAAGGIAGGEICLHASESSQYVSSILMCAPRAKQPVTLRMMGGPPISQPYIDMTTAMMASFGIDVRRSTTEEHTYHIPQGEYRNPDVYIVESDASSATYPLALAAVSRTSCTIPNIGATSLQGDAAFAVEVLRRMGAQVHQDATSTTVSCDGNRFQSICIDMTTMTDAFLTASVLAAIATGTTRITGIANQQKKECERITAVRDQLARFGVTSRLWPTDSEPDGIEIDGIPREQLLEPEIHCYDDHRVAMSFSVLAAIKGGTILERECVGKTWPGWWDTLHNTFGFILDGHEAPEDVPTPEINPQQPVYFIGMRGSGKSIMGRKAAAHLGRAFVDIDHQIEQLTGQKISEYITRHGWTAFREQEVEFLKTHVDQAVYACGGGIVESPAAREFLQNRMLQGAMVVWIERPIDDIVAYLETDQTRPAYGEEIRTVWQRRQSWYAECSNYSVYGSDMHESTAALQALLHNVYETRGHPDFFISLTYPKLPRTALCSIAKEGRSAFELRVDLLHSPHDLAFVRDQLAVLRSIDSLGSIIFTVRTKSQGGKFPDQDYPTYLALCEMALKSGVEYLDVEMTMPSWLLQRLVLHRRTTRIIASHHDPEGQLKTWETVFQRCLEYGDVVKLVGLARHATDNETLERSRAQYQQQTSKPIIMINMGTAGQPSRISNQVLTPITHPLLPSPAAPGQLSKTQIEQARWLKRQGGPRKFYLFGSPISQSKSPLLHNTLFQQHGLPWEYRLCETTSIETVKHVMAEEDFGGGSVTIPLKQAVLPLLNVQSSEISTIGAANTLWRGEHGTHGSNTDWQGMRTVLQDAKACTTGSGLVIGGGGTARAAIYALHVMRYRPIYVLGRSEGKIRELTSSFGEPYELEVVTKIGQMANGPRVAIATVPADRPIDPGMQTVLGEMFERSEKGVLVEMAYKPSVTELMNQAVLAGWTAVPGREVLAAQGVVQFAEWTGITPDFAAARDLVARD